MTPKQKLNTQEADAKLGTRVIYDKADLDEFFASRSIETLESAKRDRRYRNQR